MRLEVFIAKMGRLEKGETRHMGHEDRVCIVVEFTVEDAVLHVVCSHF